MFSRDLSLRADAALLKRSDCKNLILCVIPRGPVSLELSEQSVGLNCSHWVSQKSRRGTHVSAVFPMPKHLGNTNLNEHLHGGWMKYATRLCFSSRQLEIAESLQARDSFFPRFLLTATCPWTDPTEADTFLKTLIPNPWEPVKSAEKGNSFLLIPLLILLMYRGDPKYQMREAAKEEWEGVILYSAPKELLLYL